MNLTNNNQYTGANDASVNFGKASHFGDAAQSDNRITLTIANGTGADKVVKIFQAFNGGVSGNTANGVLADGVIGGIDTLVGSTNRGTIADIVAFLAIGKALFIGKMKVQSTLSSQLGESFKLLKKSIFRNNPEDVIALSDFTTEDNLNQNMVTVIKDFQLDNETDFTVNVKAGSTLTITLYVDAYLDVASTLSAKAKKANQHPQVAGLRAARPKK